MTLYDLWKNKESWKNTLPLAHVHQSVKTKEKDLDLAKLCDAEKNLTLDKEIGFNEITHTDYTKEIHPGWAHLLGKIEFIDDKDEKWIIDNLQKRLEEYILKLWDSNKFHLVTSGGGLDSRLLAWTLKRLEKQEGKDWLGKIHFRCQGEENIIFKSAFKKMGWDQDQYSVHKEDKLNEPDYFSLGNFNLNVNAYMRPTINFWEDILTIDQQKKAVAMNGGVGGIYFSYPLFSRDHRITENRLVEIMSHSGGAMKKLLKNYLVWDDVLMPFLSYEYMDLALRVPKKYIYKVTTKHGQDRDNIRLKLLNQFGDTGPFFIGHKYNMKFSQKRVNKVKHDYLNSKFYAHFKHHDFVENAKPWVPYQEGILKNIIKSTDLKLYGYATMYAHTNR